jgi:predicted RNase H-like nuclease
MAGVLGIDAAWTEKGPGQELDVVTADMPLSTVPITGRREADTAISRAFRGKGAAVHSPSADRPGLISTKTREGFAAAGFPLATSTTPVGTPHHLVEVYPHPTQLSLTGANYRLLCYKVSRSRRYWPDSAPAERRANLLI